MLAGGLKTNFLDQGKGEVVLLLHGWGGSLQSFLGVANELSLRFRVIVPDLWGFGKSETPPANFNVLNYALNIVELLKSLNVNKVTIVGHSFGGRIGIVLASLHPQFVNKLVLINSAGLKPRFSLKRFLKIRKYKKLKKQVKEGKKSPSVLLGFGSTDYKQLEGNMKSVFVNVVNQNLSSLLPKIKCKTLIIWGNKDRSTPIYMAKQLHKNIKSSMLYVLKGDHFVYVSKQESVLRLIFEFLGE